MKRRAHHTLRRGAAPDGQRQWSGIEELSDDPAFQAWVDAEYPAAAEFAPTARREFLKLMGASFALAGLTGCEKSPFVAAIPYVYQPEEETPGLPRYYATAVTFDGYAQPVIATTYSGRPDKTRRQSGPSGDAGPQRHLHAGGGSSTLRSRPRPGADTPRRSRDVGQMSFPDIGDLRTGWTSRQGEGLRLLIGPTTSPTLLRQIGALQQVLSQGTRSRA